MTSKHPPGSLDWFKEIDERFRLNRGQSAMPWNDPKPVTVAPLEEAYRVALEDGRRFFVSSRGFDEVIEGVTALTIFFSVQRFADEPIYAADVAKFLSSGRAHARFGGYLVVVLAGNTAPAPNIDALRAEIERLHSEIGDAARTVFDMLEQMKSKEIEITQERAKCAALDERMSALRNELERVKRFL